MNTLKHTKQILVIGLGLIGGSLAKCIRLAHPDYHIIGFDANLTSGKTAVKRGVIDEFTQNLQETAQTSDIILLAVPVKISLDYLKQLNQYSLKDSVLVTDAGSTKCEISEFAQTLKFDFIGGHPMAGSHKSGIQASDVNLFENAYYIFTPFDKQNPRVAELTDLFSGTRAKQIILTPQEHDEITAMLSHLPHIIAAALVNQADQFNQLHPHAKRLAAGGFRDITRIASSDPKMWTDILLSNQTSLIHLIDQWQEKMAEVKSWLTSDNQTQIYQFFENAKDTRDRLPVHSNGAIPAFHDLFIDVPDKPGVIAEVTTLLGQANLSIINIKILETREDIIGVLQVSFKNQADLLAGKACIEANTPYHCRVK